MRPGERTKLYTILRRRLASAERSERGPSFGAALSTSLLENSEQITQKTIIVRSICDAVKTPKAQLGWLAAPSNGLT